MNALHLLNDPYDTDEDAAVFETAIRAVPGVAGTASIHSLGLTSVLFDEHVVDDSKILETARSAGYHPRLLRRSRRQPTSPAEVVR